MSEGVADAADRALGHMRREPDPDAAGRLRQAIEGTVGSVFVEGNSVEVLRNGVEIFPSMLEAIRGAQESIDFVTFIYWSGEIAREFADVLAERSRAGVSVRVVLDALGSMPMPSEIEQTMAAGGVAIERFRPVTRWKVWEADHRTHRKILVVDNEIGFTGGVGIAEEWEGDAGGPGEWRDTHFRIEGPAVLGLRAAFLSDWRDTDHPISRPDVEVERPSPAGDVDVAVIDASAHIGLNPAERVLEALVAAAETRVLIETPYFNPVPGLLTLLERAVRRGVEVDVVVPGPNIDKRISAVMAEEQYVPLIEAGVRVWIYQPTMLHTKAVLVDGAVAVVGSINVNRRSVEKDEEAAVAILDSAIVAQLEQHFSEDLANSHPADPYVEGRPLGRRMLSLLLRPIKKEM